MKTLVISLIISSVFFTKPIYNSTVKDLTLEVRSVPNSNLVNRALIDDLFNTKEQNYKAENGIYNLPKSEWGTHTYTVSVTGPQKSEFEPGRMIRHIKCDNQTVILNIINKKELREVTQRLRIKDQKKALEDINKLKAKYPSLYKNPLFEEMRNFEAELRQLDNYNSEQTNQDIYNKLRELGEQNGNPNEIEKVIEYLKNRDSESLKRLVKNSEGSFSGLQLKMIQDLNIQN